MDKNTLKHWQIILEGPLNDYLSKKYPGEMATYTRFRKKVGPQCAFCKTAAKIIFKYEAVANKEFLNRFQNNDWSGYK